MEYILRRENASTSAHGVLRLLKPGKKRLRVSINWFYAVRACQDRLLADCLLLDGDTYMK